MRPLFWLSTIAQEANKVLQGGVPRVSLFFTGSLRVKGPDKRGHIVADTNVSPFARARNICCGHKFCDRDTKNVSQFVQPKKHHGQQCVRNN